MYVGWVGEGEAKEQGVLAGRAAALAHHVADAGTRVRHVLKQSFGCVVGSMVRRRVCVRGLWIARATVSTDQ